MTRRPAPPRDARMTDSVEPLKECPFCGGEAEWWADPLENPNGKEGVGCMGCGVTVYGDNADKFWNRRAAARQEGGARGE